MLVAGNLRATIDHHEPPSTVGRNEFLWGMPRPLPRVPHVESPFVLRAELLTCSVLDVNSRSAGS
jgi:hypothetical protein